MEVLKIIGIILMLLGVVIILTALPPIQLAIVKIGIIETEVSEIDAIRIAVGSVIFILGLIAYLGKEALKVLK